MASFSSQRLPLPNNGMPRALFTSSVVGVFVEMVEEEATEGVLLWGDSLERPAVVEKRAGGGVAETKGEGAGVAAATLMGSGERLPFDTLKGASSLVRATMYPSSSSETTRTLVPEGIVMKPTGRPSLVRSIRELVRRVPPLDGSAA